MKIFSTAILGCGNRGAESYGTLLNARKDQFRITALCDVSADKLKKYGERFGVPEKACFLDEKEFFKAKRADLLILATMDADHVRQCLKALELGYDVLLEKPITQKREECEQLLAAQKKYGGKVLVCHVLRYAPAYLKADELIREGAIGRLVTIQALEQVIYWHQAHSFVRGNWRNGEETAPMILAKCCHDLDLLQFYAKSPCKSVSSMGDLTYFTPENAPEGAAKRCTDCKYIETCPYSAKRVYVDSWLAEGKQATVFPHNQITTAYPLTEEAIYEAIRTGIYGRCVYYCDNNVVDHQITTMTFENGVKAELLMTAFTGKGGRIYKFFGTLGEIDLDEENNKLLVKRFGQEQETIDLQDLTESGYAHGGGDVALIEQMYQILLGEGANATSLEGSIESHLMGICAEESRKQGGKLVYVHGGEQK